MKGWRENGDSWFHYEFKSKNIVDKTWNTKGELLDSKGLEATQEMDKFQKIVEENFKETLWVISL